MLLVLPRELFFSRNKVPRFKNGFCADIDLPNKCLIMFFKELIEFSIEKKLCHDLSRVEPKPS